MFNALLDKSELKLDRDGNRRTAYSLRHTYICMRLIEGADIYQIAKNCGTSVEMIEKFLRRTSRTGWMLRPSMCGGPSLSLASSSVRSTRRLLILRLRTSSSQHKKGPESLMEAHVSLGGPRGPLFLRTGSGSPLARRRFVDFVTF
jgi:hypothetical protein